MIYEPLTSPHAYRLLMLHPGQGKEPLVTHLINASLDVRWFAWTALSYTWGEPKHRGNILCNQRQITITANLHSALRRLRLTDSTLLLWIDAVCINQDDNAEKAVQVSLMQRIYRQANLVIVDLGDADDDFDDVVMIWKALVIVSRNTPDSEQIHYSRYEALGLPHHFDPKWQAWRRFLERPWFGRIWTMQEYALATKVNMMYGPERIEGSALPFLIAGLIRRNILPAVLYQDNSRLSDMRRPANIHCQTMVNLLAIRQDLELSQGRSLLWSLSNLSPQCDATDKRDMVYGLLGLATDTERSALEIDYFESTPTVYCRTALLLIHQGFEIELLHEAACCPFLEGLPTWAPNWAGERVLRSLTRCNDNPRSSFAATSPARKQIKVSLDERILHVRSICVDRIEAMTEPLTGDGTSSEPFLARHMDVWQFCKNSETLLLDHAPDLRYGSAEHIAEAHWRTLVCDMKRDTSTQGYLTRPAPSSFGDLYHAFMRIFEPASEGKSSARPKTFPFFTAVELLAGGKRFCVTKDGYVGLIPLRARRGDVICVLLGATVPFVIRKKSNGNFLLIGECYIHGLMDGEALDLVLDRDDMEEKFLSIE